MDHLRLTENWSLGKRPLERYGSSNRVRMLGDPLPHKKNLLPLDGLVPEYLIVLWIQLFSFRGSGSEGEG